MEFSNQILDKEKNLTLVEAVTRAALLRLRPILMTTAAMVLGAVPLVIATGAGAESRRQIGWVVAGGMMIGTLFLFKGYYQQDMVKAWTMSLTVLAVFQWFNAWNCRHESKSIFQLNPFSNRFLVGATITVIVLQLFAIYTPLMQKILRTTALDLSDWLIIIPIASSILIVEEIRKFIYRQKMVYYA